MASTELVELGDKDGIMSDVEGGTANVSPNLPPEPDVGKGFLKPIPETTPVERVAGGLAVASVVTAFVAMIVEGSAIVTIGGILSILIGPYAYYQQTLLTDIRTLKETRAALKSEVDRLEESNTRLTSNIDNLTASVDRLEEVDQALEVITSANGQNIDMFRKQVDESKAILKSMQTNHKAAVLQNLLTVIFRSDTDRDNVIGEAEAADLLRSIRNTTQGVTIHEDRFNEAVLGKPVGAVVELVENLLRDDVPKENKIFEIQKQ